MINNTFKEIIEKDKYLGDKNLQFVVFFILVKNNIFHIL